MLTPNAPLQRLPLEPLETYMLADDSERYPRSFVIGLEFSGSIKREPFEAALMETLAHEPLLRSRVTGRGMFIQRWRVGEAGPTIEWRDDPPDDALSARRIDLRHQAGLRVIVMRSHDATRMYHVFHHAACDGRGALAVLGRICAAYSRRVRPGGVAEAAPVESGAVCHRQPAGDLPRRIGSRTEVLKSSLRRAWDVLTTPTARLSPRQPGPEAPPPDVRVPFPGSLVHVFTDPQTRALKQAARRECATLNDLLLCAMFQAVRDWNCAADPAAARAWYQIMAPVDLRSPEHDRLPAACLVSSVFVKQNGAVCEDRERLTRAVAERMQYAVTSRSALILSNWIGLVARMPGLLPLVLRAWKTQATALVSYVGDAGRGLQATFEKRRGRCVIGNLLLERITATGPVRPGTAANLTAGTYAGELILNLTLDPHLFTHDDTRVLLAKIVDRLLDYTAFGKMAEPASLADASHAG